MKKVLIIIPSFSSGGGAEKILSNILCSGDFSNYKIDIVELYHGDKGYEKLPNNINVINSYISYKYSRYKKLFMEQFAKRFSKIFRRILIKKDDYDVEITFEIMYPDVPFTKNQNTRKIAWVHGSIEEFGENHFSWRKKWYNNHFNEADKIVAISNKTLQSIVELYPSYKDKVIKIYNGYKFQEIIDKSKEEIEFAMAENSICSLGRIEYKKGSDKVLEILKRLHGIGKKYHLYYIGTGELEEKLKSRVIDYNLSEYVHFLGYQKNPYKYLKNMKCLISMSEQEGFSGAYVEALTLGVPFVSTDVGGAEELSNFGEYGKVIYNKDTAIEYIVDYVENSYIDKGSLLLFLNRFSLELQVSMFKIILE